MTVSSTLRGADLNDAAEKIGATASAVSSHARRAARAATSEAARAARDNGGVVRTVFHDLADEAEERARQAGSVSTKVGRRIASGAADQPLVALAIVGAAAALIGYALARR